jgi:hypothetical protein
MGDIAASCCRRDASAVAPAPAAWTSFCSLGPKLDRGNSRDALVEW